MGTIWRPDTCKCVIEIKVDRDPDGQFYDWTHESVNITVLEKCEAHSAVEDSGLFFQVWAGENVLKNSVKAHMDENNLTGNISFDKDRRLVVDNPAAQAWGKEQFKGSVK